MKQVSEKQFAIHIARLGWTPVRIKGSHHIFAMVGRRERIVIPIHGNQPLKLGTLHTLMKIAGLKERDL